MRSQEALGVYRRFGDALTMKIESGSRVAVSPIKHDGMRAMRKLLVGILALALCGCHFSHEPIRIGLAGSFSDPAGAPMKRAAELAVAEINAASGIRGHPVELIERDDYADPDSAVFVATDLYEAGVSAVIGHLFSGPSLAAAPRSAWSENSVTITIRASGNNALILEAAVNPSIRGILMSMVTQSGWYCW